MTREDLRSAAHDLDVTVWVGKSGIDPVVSELNDQLSDRNLVKVRFHRSSLGGTTAEDLAMELAGRVEADVVDTRGRTAVLHR
ncbi:MAG: YhbY family RNA-binding protein [Halobacteriales archaeon]|nr:YhbY family RNA-binding protein [Halobacteriales archaeon]